MIGLALGLENAGYIHGSTPFTPDDCACAQLASTWKALKLSAISSAARRVGVAIGVPND